MRRAKLTDPLAGLVLLGSGVVSGCVSPSSNLDPTPRPGTNPIAISDVDAEVVKRDVAQRLKDPASAMFGSMAGSIDGKGVVTVCGYVNARNSFGGYTGMTPFMGVLATNTSGARVFGVSGIGGSDTESLAVRIVCSKNGAAI